MFLLLVKRISSVTKKCATMTKETEGNMHTNHNRLSSIHFSSAHSFCPKVFAGVHARVCVHPGALNSAKGPSEERWESSHHIQPGESEPSLASLQIHNEL